MHSLFLLSPYCPLGQVLKHWSSDKKYPSEQVAQVYLSLQSEHYSGQVVQAFYSPSSKVPAGH